MTTMILNLLLLCVSSMYLHAVSSLPCPSECTCDINLISIRITCSPDPESAAQIIKILEFYQNSSSITAVSIIGSSLTKIPRAVCSMDALEYLDFHQNSYLSSLESQCFNTWPRLVSANFSRCSIHSLPDGLFDQKPFLKQLDFSHNSIETIGQHLFTNASNFPQLQLIDLSFNKFGFLTTLDSWPMMLAHDHNIAIDLSYNSIKELVNSANWTFKCNSSYQGVINLQDNDITRFRSLEPWFNLDGDPESVLMDVECIFSPNTNFKIQIQENPYMCDCTDMVWLIAFIQGDLQNDVINQTECFFDYSEPSKKLLDLPLLDITCNSCGSWNYSYACSCIERPQNSTYHIHCEELEGIPDELPQPYWINLTTYTYRLKITSSRIDKLAYKPYWHLVSYLDVSHTGIKRVDISAIRSLSFAQIYLNNNLIQTLSWNITSIDFKRKGKLYFQENPWDCSCSQKWFQIWIYKSSKHLGSEELTCDRPNSLRGQNLLDANFCADDQGKWKLPVSISATIIFIAIVLVVCIITIICKARAGRQTLYIINEWDDHPDATYDAFISFAWEDYDAAVSIVTMLEEEHAFKCCVHHRDFHPADSFLNQMGNAIDNSRRTLCLLSPHFVNSEYCIWEFNYAYNEDVKRGRKRLAAIMLDPIEEFTRSSRLLERYLSNINYLERGDNDFDRKLLYVMKNQIEEERNIRVLCENESVTDEGEHTSFLKP